MTPEQNVRLPINTYDAFLIAIPILFGIGIGAGLLTAVSLHIGITVSSMIGMVLLTHVLFINPPTDN